MSGANRACKGCLGMRGAQRRERYTKLVVERRSRVGSGSGGGGGGERAQAILSGVSRRRCCAMWSELVLRACASMPAAERFARMISRISWHATQQQHPFHQKFALLFSLSCGSSCSGPKAELDTPKAKTRTVRRPSLVV